VSPSRGAGRESAALEVDPQADGSPVDPQDGGSPVDPQDGGSQDGGSPVDPYDGATPVDAAARKRAAVETFARHEASLRRTAARYSICADDADEALQRTLEILLRKAPSEDPRELVRWTQTVVKHEALAVRADRERILAGPAAATPVPGREDWVAMLPADLDGPAERAERHEQVERSREALATLKPHELRALSLLAEGYSYREIGEITGFSSRKVNRCVAEGRERFRRFLVRREGGARCDELAPLLSAFADEEAGAADIATLREHLRTCAHCRSTLRAYRAAPGAAAALLPLLPPSRGALVGRLHDAYAAVATRVGGGSGASDSTLGGLAASGGSRGAGMAALAKVLAICAGTVGGAAACVATGVVPAPLLDSPEHDSRPPAKVSHQQRHLAADEVVTPTYEIEPEPQPGEYEPDPQPQEQPQSADHEKAKPDQKEEAAAETSSTTPPPSESGAVEYTEPAPAAPVEASTASASSTPSASTAPSGSSSAAAAGTAAGEFGP
jgi:RNA polymerase sigma factor (sigma-70 family)